MEKYNYTIETIDTPHESESSDKKEEIFEVIIEKEIETAFTDDLSEAGFEKDEIEEFIHEIISRDEESIKGILSTPRELRIKNFPKYFKDVESGKKTIKELVSEIARTAREKGYTLGYHSSNTDISPEGDEWSIKGLEFDDRDERPMAYYSLDYTNIFRAHRQKWLYIIRAHVGDNTSHKRDTSNNWGRADILSIVHKIDLTKIDSEVEELYQQEKESEKSEKSAA